MNVQYSCTQSKGKSNYHLDTTTKVNRMHFDCNVAFLLRYVEFWYKHKVLDEKHKCEKHWICSNVVLECHDCCADSAQTHVNLLLSKYFVFYDSSSESADKCLWSNTTTWKQPCLENILIFEHPFVSKCFLCLHKYRESSIWSPRRPPAVLVQHQVFADSWKIDYKLGTQVPIGCSMTLHNKKIGLTYQSAMENRNTNWDKMRLLPLKRVKVRKNGSWVFDFFIIKQLNRKEIKGVS